MDDKSIIITKRGLIMIDMGLSSIVNPPLVIIMDYLSIKISLMHVPTDQQEADLMMKNLTVQKFQENCL